MKVFCHGYSQIYNFRKLKYFKLLKMKPLMYTTAFMRLHNGTSFKNQSILEWKIAVTEAQKVLGFSPSFYNIRSLFEDEKIENPRYDLSSLLEDNNTQIWALIMLLISKTADNGNDEYNNDKHVHVLKSQCVLAEVTQMIYICISLHKGLENPYCIPGNKSSVNKDILKGNKMALLYGEFIIATALNRLALLRNNYVTEMMSLAVRDMSESEFFRRSEQNFSLPSRRVKAKMEWTRQNVLSVGNLLGLSCKSALHLAGHEFEMQQKGFQFGKHIALAWQAHLDFKPFIGNYYKPYTPFSLTSAPVLFHLEHDTSLFDEIEKGSESVDKVDYNKIHKCVSKGPGLYLTKQLQQHHTCKAEEILDTFEKNKAFDVLKNIINAMDSL